MEMTYLGPGICSQRRLNDGAILSVTVPATTMRSAWRGEAGSGMIPKRMESKRGPDAAIISMAQQARPNWNSHREYLRDQLRSHETGFGAPNFWTTPTAGLPS